MYPTPHSSIRYHTCLRSDNTVKIIGGGFGGELNIDAVNRLVSRHLTVKALPTGTLVFVDTSGREVALYATIDPAITDAGKVVLAEYHKVLAERERIEKEKREHLQDLIDDMDVDEALRRLS